MIHEAAVELAGVSKSYGSVLALDHVDLAVSRGDVVAVLGPNGAGKTTAISLMLGLRRPTAGTGQRLFFALSVCGDPDLLFLDEPTVAMDVEGRRLFLETVRSWAGRGRTIVLTTHHLEEADQLADRVVVIDRGTVIADASPAAIRARVPCRRVRLRLRSPLAADAFASLPVSGLSLGPGRADFLTADPAAVLASLHAGQADIADLEVVGADLEEAFLQLTGGNGRA